jgi:hypothetical protein
MSIKEGGSNTIYTHYRKTTIRRYVTFAHNRYYDTRRRDLDVRQFRLFVT